MWTIFLKERSQNAIEPDFNCAGGAAFILPILASAALKKASGIVTIAVDSDPSENRIESD